MSERNYKRIPVDRIRVINSRNRESARFREVVRSIDRTGLRKPIMVNARNLRRTGYYDLVCGEGRLLGFRALKRKRITAQVVSCTKKEALILSLVENIARVPPGTVWFAKEVNRLKEAGWSVRQIAEIVGKSENYVRDYVRLAAQGEMRLIKGVEKGLFPMHFALRVARLDNGDVQNVMMDAFDKGLIDSSNLYLVRRIIENRINNGRTTRPAKSSASRAAPQYSAKQLRSDITKITKEKEAFVNEASHKENRLLCLLDGMRQLRQDKKLQELLVRERLAEWPQLKGEYGV
jgi:ParB family chromosome partitioning protein